MPLLPRFMHSRWLSAYYKGLLSVFSLRLPFTLFVLGVNALLRSEAMLLLYLEIGL